MEDRVERNQWQEWKQQEVTKEYLKYLKKLKQDVVDSWIAADGNLIIKLSNGKEIDAGSILDPIELIKSVKHIFLKQAPPAQ